MISCSEAVERLWDYLEDEVPERDRAAVEQHLAFCRRCCGEVEFAEELRKMLASAATAQLPADVELKLTGTLDDLEVAAPTSPDGKQPTDPPLTEAPDDP